MSIRFACPVCHEAMTVANGQAGKKGQCPRCGQRVLVPPPAANKTVLGELLPGGGLFSQPTEIAPGPFPAALSPVPAEPAPQRTPMPPGTKIAIYLLAAMLITLGIVGVLVWQRYGQEETRTGESKEDGGGPKKDKGDNRVAAGDLDVKLIEARLGDAAVTERDRPTGVEYDWRPSPDRFVIRFRVTNNHANRIATWDGLGKWNDAFNTASLADEFGNTYRLVSLPADRYFTGRAKESRINPGAFTDDVVVFEKPLPKSSAFTLSLDGQEKGQKIELKFLRPR